mgnify:CR=1 FL=1
MDGFVDLPNCLKYRDLRGLWDRNRALLGRRVLWKNEDGKGAISESKVNYENSKGIESLQSTVKSA